MLRRLVCPAVFLCALLLGSYPAHAQGIFATLTGVVTDSSGGVVPNAKITLRDSGSGSSRDTTTNGEGNYTFASVPVGTSELTVEAPNFRQYKATAIGLGGGEQRKVNVQLQVGVPTTGSTTTAASSSQRTRITTPAAPSVGRC